MRSLFASCLLFAGIPCGFAQSAMTTPAQRSIAQAQQAIEKNPGLPDGYNALAIALARRARETSAVRYYGQAEDAVRKSMEVAPGNIGARKAHTWILLGKHEFAQARDVGRELNKRIPDDVLVYGFLTDANAELGNYAEAEKACNWMLKLRPGNIPALTRAAYLRELFGDVDGAIQLLTMAYQATAVAENEDRAWILTQIAHLQLMMGKTDSAGKTLHEALTLFPEYHYALANLAKVRIAQGSYSEAVDLLRRRYDAAPHAENLYDLAEALELARHKDEARKAFEEFEAQALLETGNWDNANHELVFYYADHARQPAKALEVAEREYARRRDVYTRDSYAWALHLSGRDAEARRQLETALAVGIRDAKLLRHAREIGMNLPDSHEAQP